MPGTGFLHDMPEPVQRAPNTTALKWVSKRIGVTTSDAEISGASPAALAADPGYARASGAFFQGRDGALSTMRSARLSCDERRAAQLRDNSDRLVHLADDEEPTQLR